MWLKGLDYCESGGAKSVFQKEMLFCLGMLWVVIRLGEERSEGSCQV